MKIKITFIKKELEDDEEEEVEENEERKNFGKRVRGRKQTEEGENIRRTHGLTVK